MELAHLAARDHERLPERGRDRDAADGVVDDAHRDALLRLRGERIAETDAHRIGADPVHLEQDLALRGLDGLEHRGEGLDAVTEQADLVFADDEPGARGVGALPPVRHGDDLGRDGRAATTTIVSSARYRVANARTSSRDAVTVARS